MRPLLPRLLPVLLIAAALSACTPQGPAPSETATVPQTVPVSATDEPTRAPEATPATAPTATAVPTATTAPTATPSPTPDLAANAPKEQAALDLLLEASKAQLAQPAFRASITGQDDDGAESAVVLEYVRPDKFRMSTAEAEFIIVQEGTFMREANGQWQKSPINMQPIVTEMLSEQSVEKLVEDLRYEDIEFEGVDAIDGRAMWVYRYTSTVDTGGTDMATDTRTWIGVEDALPYRMEAESDAGEGVKSTMIAVYEYDESITIEAPQVSG